MPFLFLPDLAATEAFARKLVPHVQKGDVLALEGPLGAGKTTFARAFLRILGSKENVPSPTFTLVQSYETAKFPVYHFDLYRLKNRVELDELGWDEARGEGLLLVEWPERAENRLPVDHLLLRFAFDAENKRHLELVPQGTWTSRMKGLA
jgi:tRNA threonylcarbamoyl adenosine modification protein YjeE